MTVKDLLEQEIDIDVYDDVCESLAIAFCGPMELTEAGEQKFGEVLDYEVKIYDGFVIVRVGDKAERVWQRRLRKAKEFFEAMAGYCADSDFRKWFKETV